MQPTLTTAASETAVIDQRSGDRFGIAMPITMDGVEGATLDVSDTGILFEIAAQSQPQVGSRIVLQLAYTMDGKEFQTRCEAEVVRVDQVGDR